MDNLLSLIDEQPDICDEQSKWKLIHIRFDLLSLQIGNKHAKLLWDYDVELIDGGRITSAEQSDFRRDFPIPDRKKDNRIEGGNGYAEMENKKSFYEYLSEEKNE